MPTITEYEAWKAKKKKELEAALIVAKEQGDEEAQEVLSSIIEYRMPSVKSYSMPRLNLERAYFLEVNYLWAVRRLEAAKNFINSYNNAIISLIAMED